MRLLSLSSMAVGLVLLPTGCSLAPRYERPPASIAVEYPAAGTRDSAARRATDLSWRTFFLEERLQRLIEVALANNPDLRVATLRVEQSRAQYRISRADLGPATDGAVSYSRAHAAGSTTDLWSASVGATAYELDFFGRVRSLNRQALERFLATAEAQRSAQLALVSEVAAHYFSLRLAEAQTELAERTLAAVRESLELTRGKFEAGESSALDLRTAEGQLETVRINLLAFQRQLAQANIALGLLLGRPLPADLPAPRSFTDGDLLASIAPGLPSELVQQRPDILEAEHTLKAAHANIGAARAAFFPRLALTGSAGTSSTALGDLFRAGAAGWSFVPQLTVPLFDGGRNRANLDSARIGTGIEVANYQKAVQTAFREVADALVLEENYARELAARTDLTAAQRCRLELASVRFEQGEDAYLTVLSAQQDLFGAEQGGLQARAQLLNSRLALYRALGGGW